MSPFLNNGKIFISSFHFHYATNPTITKLDLTYLLLALTARRSHSPGLHIARLSFTSATHIEVDVTSSVFSSSYSVGSFSEVTNLRNKATLIKSPSSEISSSRKDQIASIKSSLLSMTKSRSVSFMPIFNCIRHNILAC